MHKICILMNSYRVILPLSVSAFKFLNIVEGGRWLKIFLVKMGESNRYRRLSIKGEDGQVCICVCAYVCVCARVCVCVCVCEVEEGVKHCILLVLYGFIGSNALYSASLWFTIFITVLLVLLFITALLLILEIDYVLNQISAWCYSKSVIYKKTM